MKQLLLILLCLPVISFGQSIYSKDKINLGDREEFITACVRSGNKMISLNGVDIKMTSYCSCACDQLMPELYSWEIEEAVEKDAMINLFTKDKNLKIILDCAEPNIKIDDNYIFGYKLFEEYSQAELSVGIQSCVLEAKRDTELTELFTANQISLYCSCAVEKLIREGHTMGQLNKIDDENSEAFNEIALPCFENLLIREENSESSVNEYIVDDISGHVYMTEIKLNNFLGNGYKIKINIDGVVRYFLFDTGATDLIINSDMERELIFNGSIKKEDYLGEQEFVLADNSVVTGRIVRLNNVKIGDYRVNNVIASVLDGGSLLCGLGLLDKFRKWDFIKDFEILKIYK